MSVKVMSAVFDRYHRGGSEMLLALALADHAHEDGTHVYPSVAALAAKTRQSERAVQYQLRQMEAEGWLILVGHEKGGRGQPREYRINPEWIKGADLAPLQKGCNPASERVQLSTERVQPDVEKGATAIAPEPSGTVIEPSVTVPAWLDREVWDAWLRYRSKELRKPVRPPLAQRQFKLLAELQAQGNDPTQVIRQSMEAGWTGLFALKSRGRPQNDRSGFFNAVYGRDHAQHSDDGAFIHGTAERVG